MKIKKEWLEKGFSLVELLVVISIIAVLTAVLTTNYMGMRERARDAQKIQDLGSIRDALRSYYNDHQSYPEDISDIGTSNYMPSITNLGYSYTYTRIDSDAFVLKVDLEAGAGTDDTDSQVRCGIAPTAQNVFAVCAN